MRWKKLGRVFSPSGEVDWMTTHAANPFAENLGDGQFRVYFSGRDKTNRSSIGTLEINLSHPLQPVAIATKPVLAPGDRGLFDDSGLSMGCIVETGDSRYLYYLGWNLGTTVPFRNSIGLAISRDGAPFEKFAPAPIMDRNAIDPYCLSYPWVMKVGDQWHLWYGSHLKWGREHGAMEHVIKHASSSDGLHWERSGSICIGLEGNDWGVSRPCVVKEGGVFRMWFSRRHDQYQLGYAESTDGIHWKRKDSQVGIFPSAEGWDSESISYPHVFAHGGKHYLLYCGKQYGKTGFGIAVEDLS